MSDPPPNVPDFFADSRNGDDFSSRWDQLWKARCTPWDRDCPSPALVDLLAEPGRDFFPAPRPDGTRRKALVPGAGKGHDVLLLSSYGYDVYGLDISPEASAAAEKNAAKNCRLDIYAAKEGVDEKGAVSWLVGDFFKFDFADIGQFDLIFDYTFLCALPPALRPQWSAAMKKNLAPRGRLVCHEFPTTKPTHLPGPPFPLPSVVYEALLGRPGQDIPYDSQQAVNVPKLGPQTADALQRLHHIVPARVHPEGYDKNGNVVDRISVWAHRDPESSS